MAEEFVIPEITPDVLNPAEIGLGLLGRLLPPAQPGAPQSVELYLQRATRNMGGREAARAAAARFAETLAGTPLGAVVAALDLPSVETVAVALCLEVETEAMAGRAVAFLQAPVGGSRPTLGLLASALAPLVPGSPVLPMLASGRAVAAGLLSLSDAGPLPERHLSVPADLALCLAGAPPGWPGLDCPPPAPAPDWPDSLATALAPVAAGLATGLNGATGTLLILRGMAQADQAEVAARLAQAQARRPAFLDLERIEPRGLGPYLTAAGLLPVFRGALGPGEHRALPDLPGYRGAVIAMLGPDGSLGRAGLALTEWTLPLPDRDERAAMWATVLEDPELCARLGGEHLQSAGRIRDICRSARAEARLRGSDRVDAPALRAAVWTSEGDGLGALAQPVRDTIPDETLITNTALRRDLGHLLARCRQRERLTEGLGGAVHARYKLGVRALFVGPSGTGKTLAAAWIAGQMTLPIYRVDLAAVSSKYIGETEKNLAHLLAKAEEQDIVLLFDEADSLFGKRTDISDANDRFANAQTNYLLQRIESFSGIVLLTSNSKNRFDEAFTRRIDAIVDFSQPEATERMALWRAHLGAGHRLRPVEMNRLAAFADVTGGHIRNVVLMAAVLAREAGVPIGYVEILDGLRAEYRKLGLTLPTELTMMEAGR